MQAVSWPQTNIDANMCGRVRPRYTFTVRDATLQLTIWPSNVTLPWQAGLIGPEGEQVGG